MLRELLYPCVLRKLQNSSKSCYRILGSILPHQFLSRNIRISKHCFWYCRLEHFEGLQPTQLAYCKVEVLELDLRIGQVRICRQLVETSLYLVTQGCYNKLRSIYECCTLRAVHSGILLTSMKKIVLATVDNGISDII